MVIWVRLDPDIPTSGTRSLSFIFEMRRRWRLDNNSDTGRRFAISSQSSSHVFFLALLLGLGWNGGGRAITALLSKNRFSTLGI
jgi:hypothetical protein